MSPSFQITFAGAADTVTGSRHLVVAGGKRLLLDCGIFQGFKTLRLRNWSPFPVPPRGLDAVVLSHAHLDHAGYLPALVRDGFRGPIICSKATRDLAEVMLLDSAHLLQEEAAFANRHDYSKHRPALPLYTVDDVRHCLKQFEPVAFQKENILGAVRITLTPAGHLLGAASVSLEANGHRLVFSGDLGREHDVLMPPPQHIATADVLLVESTYGNRRHPVDDAQQKLGLIVRETVARGGTVLLPSFAVGRSQALMLLLHRLKQRGDIPDVPVFLDSPMAARATTIYRKHGALLRLNSEEREAMCNAATFVGSPTASRKVSGLNYPSVIIAGSGMATGGRILHHLKTYAPDPRSHIVFPGFQVPGTRGAKLLAGDLATKIHGSYIPVNARVSHIEGLSGHADADEVLGWLRGFKHAPKQTFVVHGEREAADALRLRISDELGWNVATVEHMQVANC